MRLTLRCEQCHRNLMLVTRPKGAHGDQVVVDAALHVALETFAGGPGDLHRLFPTYSTTCRCGRAVRVGKRRVLQLWDAHLDELIRARHGRNVRAVDYI